MWKLLKISEQTYFIYCNFNINKQEVCYILYDLKETWSQTLSLVEVKKKVKLLNKSFDFSEDNIKEAFTGDCLQTAAIEEQPPTNAIQKPQEQQQYSCLLKLKYRVKNAIMSYEWNLKKQTVQEFQQSFVHPLLLSLMGCHEQIEILKESIRKKDLELTQYRLEGAVLSRKTLATKPFNFEEFTQKYEDCNNIAINFKELAKYVQENDLIEVPDKSKQPVDAEKIETDVKPEENSETTMNNTKLSPKQKKRKVKEIKKQRFQEYLKHRKQGLEYESSQTPSTGNSQITDDIEEKVTKTQQQPSPSKQAAKNNLTLRKSARCTPTKLQQLYMSSEDKTDDSDIDNKPLSLRRRKFATNATKTIENSNAKTSKEESNKKSENNKSNEKRTRSCVRSLNLFYNSHNKSLDKSSESSNISDFSTDTEDDNLKKDKVKPKRASNKSPLSKNKRNKRSTAASSVITQKSDNNESQSKRIKRNITKSPISPFTVIPIPIVQLSDTDDDRPLKANKNSLDKSLNMNIKSVITIGHISPRSKNQSHSLVPAVMDDLSSQLNNIKKDLESLEAMRLADLKQRMCKA